MKKSYILLSGIMLLPACAKHTQDIPSEYVSPMQYESYSCKQLEAEMQTVSQKVSDIGAQQDKIASDDSAQMGVGLLLLWPTLFFLDGDTPQAHEYAHLKGEFDALEHAAIQKNCGLHVERPVIKQPEPQKEESQYPRKR